MLACATWNIHRCVGRDRRYDPGRTRSVLREIGADLVALQEVEVLYDATDLLAYLTEGSEWLAIPAPTLRRSRGHYGNALLTRLPVVRHRHVDLSLAGREPRGAIHAVMEWAGSKLRLLATHLGLGAKERRVQTLRLLELLGQQRVAGPADVTVLVGDLNEWLLWGRPLRWLRSHFLDSPAPPSFPAGWPVLALDRIWVEPRNRLVEVRTWSSPAARLASDHLPVVARLRGAAIDPLHASGRHGTS